MLIGTQQREAATVLHRNWEIVALSFLMITFQWDGSWVFEEVIPR